MPDIETIITPYELLVRFTPTGEVAGAHRQDIVFIVYDGGTVGSKILDPRPITAEECADVLGAAGATILEQLARVEAELGAQRELAAQETKRANNAEAQRDTAIEEVSRLMAEISANTTELNAVKQSSEAAAAANAARLAGIVQYLERQEGAEDVQPAIPRPEGEGWSVRWDGWDLHINKADAVAFQSLEGVGPTLAARLVAAQPFDSFDALSAVSGVSPAMVEEWKLTPGLAL